MKVLLAYSNNLSIDNPFVKTLKEGLNSLGCDVDWGLNEFWTNYMNYHIIHINWPNSLFESWNPTNIEILHLEYVLDEIKKNNIKIVYTRHNDQPHYSSGNYISECYELIEKNADAIIHLGHYGISQFEKKLDCKQFIIPHHIYDSIYKNEYSKDKARKKLNIPTDKFVILTFGAYRDKEEVDLILDNYKNLPIKNKYLLAPRLGEWLGLESWHSKIGRLWFRSKVLNFKLKKQNIKTQTEFISDEELPYYFLSADIVLIQRKKILNSGNLPLAYYFNKVVVGPDSGNVGEILRETNNIIFDPNSQLSISDAILSALDRDITTLGKKNHEYAIKNWNIKSIAIQYLDIYKDLLKGKEDILSYN